MLIIDSKPEACEKVQLFWSRLHAETTTFLQGVDGNGDADVRPQSAFVLSCYKTQLQFALLHAAEHIASVWTWVCFEGRLLLLV